MQQTPSFVSTKLVYVRTGLVPTKLPRCVSSCSSPWSGLHLFINFVDQENAFDSVDLQSLWKLLRHYGIPEKITNIIRNSYEGMTCRVVHGRQLTDAFEVRTGVRQGCLLLPVMFLLTMGWAMKTSTAQGRNGIQWTLWKQLDDLDYADDLALLSHTRHQMQGKNSAVAGASASSIKKEDSKRYCECETFSQAII